MPEKPDLSEFVPDTCWPSSWQELLLQSVIGPEEYRDEAWRFFRRSFDIEKMDRGSNAIVSLLWTSIGEGRIDIENRDRIKGTWRHQWVLHERLGNTLQDLLSRLGGVVPAVVDDTASALLDYPPKTLRPWTELRLAVRPDQRRDVHAILEEDGWERTSLPGANPGATRWTREGSAPLRLTSVLFTEPRARNEAWKLLEEHSWSSHKIRALPRYARYIRLSHEEVRWFPVTPLLALTDAAILAAQLHDGERRALIGTAREWSMIKSVQRVSSYLATLGVEGAARITAESSLVRARLPERADRVLRESRKWRVFLFPRNRLRAIHLRWVLRSGKREETR